MKKGGVVGGGGGGGGDSGGTLQFHFVSGPTATEENQLDFWSLARSQQRVTSDRKWTIWLRPICTQLFKVAKPVHEDLTIVKRRKLQWYGHVSRSSGLAKNHIARHSEGGEEDEVDRGRGGKTTSGNGQAGVHQVPEGSGEQGKWSKLVAKWSVVPQWLSRFRDKWWCWWWNPSFFFFFFFFPHLNVFGHGV